MVEQMKRIARQTEEAGKPMRFMIGQVTAADPLTIRVDNRFDISNADTQQIWVMKQFQEGYYPTHRHRGFKDAPQTEETSGGGGDEAFSSHAHTLKNTYWTEEDDSSEYYYGLQVGDKVVLLRQPGGQEYLVLGRV